MEQRSARVRVYSTVAVNLDEQHHIQEWMGLIPDSGELRQGLIMLGKVTKIVNKVTFLVHLTVTEKEHNIPIKHVSAHDASTAPPSYYCDLRGGDGGDGLGVCG